MTEMLPTWLEELESRGETVPEGRLFDCPDCGAPAPAFAIVKGADGGFRCGRCLNPEPVGGDPELTWNDVRGQRSIFLAQSDWSQLADVPATTRLLWAPLRQRARDLTKAATVAEALALLEALREDAAKV